MLLLCVSAYLVASLLFTALYWMSVVVGRRHEEENKYLLIDAFDSGD